ncbi:hypothetical protein C7H19_22980 [Aphanothece hegewaldii CCALA 016]|uniref:DUF2808 domain-containing protein n=1 Tax=Aphanothece hegewaldii CCALA 016 TaxID=2107694 RepID=A0A2T1LRI1_9CHRO|nr:DUF2808 domain-containing protein [Aphanothece hegewaldii]PSF31305.1 hypothetical protein C7H19_22980 [Aphanothece hegewaldii CCALA 016]
MFKQAFILTSILSLLAIPAAAVQFPDGRSSFEKAPRLVDMITTQSSARVWIAKYYVTIDLPSNIGEPLQQVTIQQRQGFDNIRYRINETVAFTGTPRRKGEAIAIKSATFDQEQNLVTVIFDPPVPPGQTVTIGIVPTHNPDNDGVYLFGITAFPAGEKPLGLYLGVGRLQFYLDNRFF